MQSPMKYSSIHAILLCAASLGVVGVSAEESSVVDVMPAPPTGIEADPGFFPTLQDSAVLSGPQGGDPDYFRSSGGALNAPDLPYQAAADEFWNYQTQPNPMSRLQRILLPFDYVLQPLTRGWGYNVGQSETGFSSFDLGGNVPGFTRSYSPERSQASFLLGEKFTRNSPLFFDVLNVSVLGAYGHGSRPSSVGDGFIAGISTDIRGVLRLTDRTSFMVDGRLYLTWDEDSGADSGFGLYFTSGQPTAFATLLHQVEWGTWDFTLFDYAGAISGWDMFRSQTYDGAFAATIGASIGIQDYEVDRGDWFDTNRAWLYNHSGLRAGTFIGRDWRFLAGFTRRDTWSFDGFDHRQGSELWDAGLYYNNNGWWFAPSINWTSYSNDFEFVQHALWVNATAPLSPNITAYGGVGYTFGPDQGDRFLWRVGASWQMTDRLMSFFDYSQSYHSPDVGDSWLGTMLGYRVQWAIGPRAKIGYSASWTSADRTSDDVFSQGVFGDYALGNYCDLHALVGRQDRDANGISSDTMVYSLELRARLAARLFGVVGYRNSDYTSDIGPDGNWGTAYIRLTRTF